VLWKGGASVMRFLRKRWRTSVPFKSRKGDRPVAVYYSRTYAAPEWAQHNLYCRVSILQMEGHLGLAMRRWPQVLGSILNFKQD
jgi:hypothetical protein